MKINMADRGRSPRSRTRISQAPWDFANPANWTAGKLKSELEKMNIILPLSLGKNMLKRIYQDNVTRRQSVSELRPNISDATCTFVVIIYSCIKQLFDMRHARRSSSVGDFTYCIYIVLINNEIQQELW